MVYDVIVIGAGPCGSRTAYRLAKMGYCVTVLEKRSALGQKPCCTGIISQECIDRFDIPENLILRQVNSVRIVMPSGKFIGISRSQNQAAVVDRRGLDRHLADLTRACGVPYHLHCQAEYISLRPEKVVIGIKDEGYDYQLEARSVVLATGFGSVLVKDLGLGRPAYLAAGVQAEIRLNNGDDIEVFFGRKTAPGFFAWLVPTARGKGLAGLVAYTKAGDYLRKWLNELTAAGKVISEAHTLKYGGIPLRPISRTYTDRVLVVGDAAGQVKPTTGGGIYFGLLCADIAAETLNKSFQSGSLDAASLSLYEENWRKKLGPELRREIFARRMFERLSDSQIEKLIEVSYSSGLIDTFLQDESTTFDWHGSIVKKVLTSGLKTILSHRRGQFTYHSD